MPPKKRTRFGKGRDETKEQKMNRRRAEAERIARLRSQEDENQRVIRQQRDVVRYNLRREQEHGNQRIARQQRDSEQHRLMRSQEDEEQRRTRQQRDLQQHRLMRSQEDEEQRRTRQQRDLQRHNLMRSQDDEEQRRTRQQRDTTRQNMVRAQETQLETENRQRRDRQGHNEARLRPFTSAQWLHGAFNYDPQHDYESESVVRMGSMASTCRHCRAKKWANEPHGMCCSGGKVSLPLIAMPPNELKELLDGTSRDSTHFLKCIRKYNSSFQMTSFGAKYVSEEGFMPTFKVQGQVYHSIGSLLPQPNEESKFLQIYFVGDEQQQARVRCTHIEGVKHDIILRLQAMLHTNNNYVRSFKCALESQTYTNFQVVIDADKRPVGEHPRRYNAPLINEVAVIIGDGQHNPRDIVLKNRGSGLKRISETHRSYDSLQYPLLFVYGEDGYYIKIPHSGDSRKYVSCMQYYSFMFMVRQNNFNLMHRCRILFSQFATDMYAKTESERLLFITLNQKKLRSDDYVHLRDMINNDARPADLGQLCILPSSFTGGPRYMHERIQDAMTYVRVYGRPDLFITFTCNSNWKEIQDELFPGQSSQDRHDVVARVFRLKVVKMMHLFTKSQIFGSVKCNMHTIEWQKRGLPHAHILLWLAIKINPNDIDKIICAEIPEAQTDPILYEIVKKHMIHGPCGQSNLNAPCMNKEIRRCTKKFPKKFVVETQHDNDGYPTYRRRKPEDGGKIIEMKKNGIILTIDNRWVVPYNPLLLKTFNSHINIEFCQSVKSIKYICKYVNKGSDAAVFAIQQENVQDEVKQYQLGRYISTNEAFWRIFGFPIHERHPAVQQLTVHLKNDQRVYFTEDTAVNQALNPKDTTLMAFFKLCVEDEFAKTLYYHQVSSYYTWNKNKWHRRKRGAPVVGHPNIKFDTTIGRVYTVHPSQSESFHLRMLLHKVKGPTSFEYLKEVDGHVCQTFREACLQLGLLEDDKQYEQALSEAAISRSPKTLRELFAIILKTCETSNPAALWMQFRNDLSEDFHYRAQTACPNIDIPFSVEIYNEALVEIEDHFIAMGGEPVTSLGLPQTTRGLEYILATELIREKSYDHNALSIYHDENITKLLLDQNEAYSTVINNVQLREGGVFFLNAPGGTGKTFVIKLLLAKVRSERKVALATASSGIAATLLDGGRTAHSTFKIPFDLNVIEQPVCSIKKTSGLGTLIKQCVLIIWDECTMANKKALEALDRTLRDIRDCDEVFGGVTFLLSGDFRQTLPVIQKGTKMDELNASIKSSYLWCHVRSLNLSTNMRAQLSSDPSAQVFANGLLELGEGRMPIDENQNINPLSICNMVDSIDNLIDKVFPNHLENYRNTNWICERAIMAPKNTMVNAINTKLLNTLPGEQVEYNSIDTVIDEAEVVNYPQEFLNSLEPPGAPPHRLLLKIGAPIMVLRNLNQPKLVNGTRLVVKKLMRNCIEAEIVTGCGKGENVFIPRIPIIPSNFPFQFKRLQFPIRLSYAITINKSQGQSMRVAGLHLEEPCFSHGQLYVGASRVGAKENLFVFAPTGKTKNIVYKEIFNLN